MKKFALVLLAVAAPAFAIPEPYWIRVNEIVAIAQHADLKKTIQTAKKDGLGSGFIEAIERDSGSFGNTKYTVRTGNCGLQVRVTYDHQPHVMGTGKMILDWDKALQCE